MKIKRKIGLASFVAFAAAVSPALSAEPSATPAEQRDEIRPFRANVSEEQLTDLRRRLLATRWPDKETVADQSRGVQLAKLQELVRYWDALNR
jgi:hypothetical protein